MLDPCVQELTQCHPLTSEGPVHHDHSGKWPTHLQRRHLEGCCRVWVEGARSAWGQGVSHQGLEVPLPGSPWVSEEAWLVVEAVKAMRAVGIWGVGSSW